MRASVGLFLSLMTQCVIADLNQCLGELFQVFEHFATVIPTTKYEEMASYSGKGINDLGDYFSCCDLDGAEYALFTVPVGTISAYLSLCGPQSCTIDDYQTIIRNITETETADSPLAQFAQRVNEVTDLAQMSAATQDPTPISVSITFPHKYIHENYTYLSPGAVVMLVVCIGLVAIAAAGTVIDIMKSHKVTEERKGYELMESEKLSVNEADIPIEPPKPPQRDPLFIGILLCFSLYTNAPKLFASRSAEKLGQKRDTLDILNGVRVMSMGWVILGHVYSNRFLLGVIKNPLEITEVFKRSKTAIIYGALFAVDSFFWLSGFLMTFLLMPQLNSSRSISPGGWGYLYAHRFYRILPAYMFVLFLSWAFIVYIGNGPVWPGIDIVSAQCKDYWWTNLIFLNNFLPDGKTSTCLAQTWYLANDMQFFLISPPIFILYHKVHRLFGWALVAGLCLCAILTSTLIADSKGLNTVVLAPINTEKDFTSYLYEKPYCRVAPYAVGVACGMVLYSYRLYKKTGEVYDKYALWFGQAMDIWWVRYLSYTLGLFFINFFIFIQYSIYKDIDDGWTNWNQAENDLFIGFNRFFWAVGMSLVLMPMLQGYNKVGTWFLSLDVWVPLARLNFCTYLIHLSLVAAVFLSQNEAYWFDDLNITISLTFITVISYAAAVPVTLLVESPFMAFEKLMKSRSPSKGK